VFGIVQIQQNSGVKGDAGVDAGQGQLVALPVNAMSGAPFSRLAFARLGRVMTAFQRLAHFLTSPFLPRFRHRARKNPFPNMTFA
jgi:hypothetical protein